MNWRTLIGNSSGRDIHNLFLEWQGKLVPRRMESEGAGAIQGVAIFSYEERAFRSKRGNAALPRA
jgi:hypothetical protein